MYTLSIEYINLQVFKCLRAENAIKTLRQQSWVTCEKEILGVVDAFPVLKKNFFT
jgi:hypothetical protein